jgi:hypothetical protein
MEVKASFARIEKFCKRPCNISLRGFKATFSIVVYEYVFKYGTNYIKVFTLDRYVQCKALDVYEQHFLRNLGVTQIPNLAYATTIAIASQIALQATICTSWDYAQ